MLESLRDLDMSIAFSNRLDNSCARRMDYSNDCSLPRDHVSILEQSVVALLTLSRSPARRGHLKCRSKLEWCLPVEFPPCSCLCARLGANNIQLPSRYSGFCLPSTCSGLFVQVPGWKAHRERGDTWYRLGSPAEFLMMSSHRRNRRQHRMEVRSFYVETEASLHTAAIQVLRSLEEFEQTDGHSC